MQEVIYDYILSHRKKDGTLPKTFSLPQDETENGLKFVDGALDGIAYFHTVMKNTPEEDDAFLTRVKNILSQVFHTEQEEELNKLGEELNTLSKDGRMLPHIDTIQQYIQRNADTLNGVALYHFASQLLTTSKDTEAVKLGLSILELFHTDQDASLKDIIRILSRCNEFTLFAGYVMRQWKHGNEDLFQTLKEVDGWGRIFGIELLEVDGGEIRAWLMAEGVHNTILPGYSAINTYEKTSVRELVKNPITTKEYRQVAEILMAMVEPGPIDNIAYVDDPRSLFEDFFDRSDEQEDFNERDRAILQAIKDYYDAHLV